MVILGVDPGSMRTGWGAIRSDGRRHHLLDKGVLAPPPRDQLPARLRYIHAGMAEIIARLAPDILAVEDLFHAKSARAALVLGHVRGVILLAGAEAGLRVQAFPPATVKLQVTGQGQAEKGQIAFMVARMLALPGDGEAGDAADALAVALCHAHLHGLAVPAS
ncbi:MAG: crossover junction endodeoxyribonuclease RuvC [Acidobacteria bacterium]|nr:MAG: crossover junction endodeoxyribonuclease RuvC [Acidobacteriota bacterium]